MNMIRYIVCCGRPWAVRVYERIICQLPGEWHVLELEDHVQEYIAHVQPRYVFFLHWSDKVPDDICSRYECINFHMTDLPYGRGGSPLQNLIVRGHQVTQITAHRMTGEIDAGPIYCRHSLELAGATAEEIYIRAMETCAHMIKAIIEVEPISYPQTGESTIFKRRKPEQSMIPDGRDLVKLFDHIRMLDAEGYPRAFLLHGGMRYEVSRPALRNGRIVADVEITEVSS